MGMRTEHTIKIRLTL